MKIRDCGKKFAVVTSRYHKNGGFEETMPEDTMWLCERNPDVAAFLKEAALRRVDIVLVDEDGTPFPDISMADLKGFAREQVELGHDKPLGKWFDFLPKYVFVGITAAVIVLGIFYGGIG